MGRKSLGAWLALLVLFLGACADPANAGLERLGKAQFGGFYGTFAADASVLKEAGAYRMYYTEYRRYSETEDSSGICMATSMAGRTWSIPGAQGAAAPPFVLEGIEGSQEEDLETCFCILWKGEYLLYYCGYPREGVEVYPGSGLKETMGSAIYLARSADGAHFTRQGGPVLERGGAGSFDEDALFSPSVIPYGEGLFMVYAGHRYDPNLPSGVYVLGAYSADGIAWTKVDSPLLLPGSQYPSGDPASAYAWMRSGAGEPEIVAGADGAFCLFFTGLDDARGTRSIGMARAPDPWGPYTIRAEAILSASASGFDSGAVLAPSVLIEGGRLRLWYNGMGEGESSWLIGYAEGAWPLE
jgi:hypothetical protein